MKKILVVLMFLVAMCISIAVFAEEREISSGEARILLYDEVVHEGDKYIVFLVNPDDPKIRLTLLLRDSEEYFPITYAIMDVKNKVMVIGIGEEEVQFPNSEVERVEAQELKPGGHVYYEYMNPDEIMSFLDK